ncbi:MAG: type II secretion system protein [Candidatus Levybacteria bacterium]|nr:type II secretion system protein [Candidatus Levybacteria bacterium]
MKNIRNNNGFTIIEMLTVLSILIVISSVIGAIIVSSLRGTSKINENISANRNGGYIIDQMSKMIRNAYRLDYPFDCFESSTISSTFAKITITNPDGYSTTFSCIADNEDGADQKANIASQSGASKIKLIDESVLKLNECYFKCSRKFKSSYPIIDIYFSLKPKSNKSSVDVFPFQTSIMLRNIR